MVEKLGLDGINSHNAIDDAHATALLLLALAEKAHDLKHKIELVRLNNKIRRCAEKFNTIYGEFYRKWRSKLHDTDDSADNTLCGAISSADKFFASHGFTTGIQKLDYVLALIDRCIIDTRETPVFGSQVSRYLFDLLSFNEADLFTNGIVDERLSVMTVHKAKGLEMDNVVVFDASSFYGDIEDHARLLYVAFSRARKRLAVGLGGRMPKPMIGLQRYFKRLTPSQIRIAVNCEYLNLGNQTKINLHSLIRRNQ